MKLSRSRPNAGAPARCSAASPRPSASSCGGPRRRRRSTPARGSAASSASPTASTPGVRSAPASASQRSPRPRPRNIARGRVRAVFTNSRRPSASSTPQRVVDVAAGDRARPPRPRAPSAARDRGRQRAGHHAPRRPRAQVREQARAGALDHVEHVLEAVGAAVVRVGHVEVAVARPGRTRAAGGPWPRASRVGRERAQVGGVLGGPSPAAGRSASKSAGRELPRRALHRRSRARRASPSPARSGGSPTCQPPVPALSTSTSPSSPACGDQVRASPPRPSASGRCCPGRRSRSGTARYSAAPRRRGGGAGLRPRRGPAQLVAQAAARAPVRAAGRPAGTAGR